MPPFTVVRQLHEGAYANVFVVKTQGGERACKVAHRASEAPRPTRPPFVTSGVAFATGSMGAYEPDPNEILAHERDALVRVTSPHIVTVHGFSMHPEADGPRAYLLTRYVQARSWRARLTHKAPPTLDEYMHLTDVVASLHESNGWFHGDLKPDNVLGEGANVDDFVMIDPSSGVYEFGGSGPTRDVRRAFTTPAYNPFVARTTYRRSPTCSASSYAERRSFPRATTSPPVRGAKPPRCHSVSRRVRGRMPNACMAKARWCGGSCACASRASSYPTYRWSWKT